MLLIDGHNLIPKIPGLSLRNLDDEQDLIARLQAYCAARSRSLEVFFDAAPVGRSGKRSFGRVTAHFVRQGSTADEAIRLRLAQLGRGARNATVVSSDRQVQVEARNRGAQVLRSEDFAEELMLLSRQTAAPVESAAADNAGANDLQEFFELFGGEPQEGPPPPPKRLRRSGKKPTKL